MPLGSLTEFLVSRKGKAINLSTQTRMACDVAEGMAFLEEKVRRGDNAHGHYPWNQIVWLTC